MTTVVVVHRQRVSVSALLDYLPRLCRWPALGVGVVIAWALTWWRAGDVASELGAVWLLRGAVVIGVVAAVFALDDPSRNVTEPLIGTRRRLAPLRLGAAAVVVALAALPAAVLVGDHLSATVGWGLALEAFAVLALLCGISLTLQRRWRISEPAQFVVLSVLLIAVADQVTAGRWPLLAGPGPQWADAHWRWAALGLVAVGVLFWQLRDPASRARFLRQTATVTPQDG